MVAVEEEEEAGEDMEVVEDMEEEEAVEEVVVVDEEVSRRESGKQSACHLPEYLRTPFKPFLLDNFVRHFQ